MNRARILKYFSELRASYWFIPSLMTLGAILLSVVTITLDSYISADWPERVPFIFSNKPEGARALLATVAGSMITVAGVTFSLTLLAVSHATGQFGPRLLNNFMRDRGNQITLGTFTATFIYCLMVLRTVRSAETAPAGKDNVEGLISAFVPHISVTIALLLTLCSVAVLIFFMHHVPESIRVSKVLSGVGRSLVDQISTLFPEMIAETQPETREVKPVEEIPEGFSTDSVEVKSTKDGYIQAVDETGLLAITVDKDLVLEFVAKPGEFVYNGQTLVRVGPSANADEKVRKSLHDLFALGAHPTANQNVVFLVDQLVEVAQRALSPGINDPNTAISCMNWLQASLVSLAKRKDPEQFRYDEEGNLRIFTNAIDFRRYCDHAFDQLRPCVAVERNAAMRLMRLFMEVKAETQDPKRIEILDHHADRLLSAAEQSSLARVDIDDLRSARKAEV